MDDNRNDLLVVKSIISRWRFSYLRLNEQLVFAVALRIQVQSFLRFDKVLTVLIYHIFSCFGPAIKPFNDTGKIRNPLKSSVSINIRRNVGIRVKESPV